MMKISSYTKLFTLSLFAGLRQRYLKAIHKKPPRPLKDWMVCVVGLRKDATRPWGYGASRSTATIKPPIASNVPKLQRINNFIS
jgi:hypothetical protein